MNSTPNFPGQNQGTGDEYALMLELFGGEVLTAFFAGTIFRDKIHVKRLANGKSFKFPAIWRATARYHTPGQELTGSQIPHTEVEIKPDQRLVADVFIDEADEILNHYDVRAPYSEALGRALAEHYDANIFRTLIRAARGGPLFVGDQGGSTLTNAAMHNSATVLMDAISAAKETLDIKNVKVDSMPVYASFRPAQWYLMARSDKNLNRDTNGGDASIRKHTLTTIDDVNIVKSNIQPSGVDDSANTGIPAKYRLNMANTVGAVWVKDCAASVEVQSPAGQVVPQAAKQGTLMIARQMVGTDPLRNKCAVELARS